MNGVAVAVAIGVPRLVPVMCSVPEGHRDCGRQGVRVHPRSFPATPSAERGGGRQSKRPSPPGCTGGNGPDNDVAGTPVSFRPVWDIPTSQYP